MILYKYDNYRYLEFHGTLPNKIIVVNILQLIENSDKYSSIHLAYLNECILISREDLLRLDKIEYEDTNIEYYIDFNRVFEKRKNRNRIKYKLSIQKPMED